MTAEKPTLVFVPGAWHSPAYYDQVIAQLQKYGYPTQALHLPSAGKDFSSSSHDDAAFIQKTTSELADQGKDIVIIMHSYGGVPGTDSVKGLRKEDRKAEGKTGGIVSLVYLCAFMIPEGKCVLDMFGDNPPEWSIIEAEKSHATRTDEIFYNDLPAAEAEKYSAQLLEHSSAAFASPLKYAAYKHVPTTYLMCEKDNAMPFPLQEIMVGFGGDNVTKHVCGSGHSPMLTVPDTVTSIIRQAAGEIPN